MFLVDPKVVRFVVKGQSHIFGGSKGVGVTIESYRESIRDIIIYPHIKF
jgi:hypothetical protein